MNSQVHSDQQDSLTEGVPQGVGWGGWPWGQLQWGTELLVEEGEAEQVGEEGEMRH